jgi:hypothetical protein
MSAASSTTAIPPLRLAQNGDPLSVVDGFLVNEETGEILGLAEQDHGWQVDSPDKADWVLSLMAQEEAQLEALEMRKQALLHNLERMAKEHERRLDYLRYRFGGGLQSVARAELEGGKSRTLRLPHGSLAFRKVAGSSAIKDMDAAVAWAAANAPSLVRTTTKTDVLAGEAAKMLDAIYGENNPARAYPAWMERTDPRETFTIKTGIGDG